MQTLNATPIAGGEMWVLPAADAWGDFKYLKGLPLRIKAIICP
jgi:hypothetical protein